MTFIFIDKPGTGMLLIFGTVVDNYEISCLNEQTFLPIVKKPTSPNIPNVILIVFQSVHFRSLKTNHFYSAYLLPAFKSIINTKPSMQTSRRTRPPLMIF